MNLKRTIRGRNGEYVIHFNWGKEDWLPMIGNFLMISIWDFIFSYSNRFVELVQQYYGIDLELASMDDVAIFFIQTGLIEIETKKGGKLTDYAVRQAKAIVKAYRDIMINESNLL